jgi:hypothetical protein
MSKMEGWAERLERKAEGRFKPGDDGMFTNSWPDLFNVNSLAIEQTVHRIILKTCTITWKIL